MLTLLHMENIAVMEAADVAFGPGLNVLTGETGAGKSILVDAINMVMGQRASKELIRTGAERALVTAVFQNVPDLPWFSENGIFQEDDGTLFLTRQLHKDGRGLCRVGSRPVPVSALRELGSQLLNIHGQQDGLQLLSESRHLWYLDRFAGADAARAAYREAYRALREIEARQAALQMDEGEKTRRIQSLQDQIEALEQADLKEGEEEALAARRALLQGSGKYMEALEHAGLYLSGDEREEGAVSLLESAALALDRASDLSEDLSALAVRLEEAVFTAKDVAEEVRDLRYRFDFSPDELDLLEARLFLLDRLGRKYAPGGGGTAALLAHLARCREELDQICLSDDALARLEQAVQAALERATRAAEALSALRRQAAASLAEQIEAELSGLNMKGARFQVDFSPKSAPLGLDDTGMDQVRFLLSANAGETPRPLSKIASGGELARIMLAMKSVLAADDDAMTLVFDEVDTGVSGRAASRVAEKLRGIARVRQVLCVTHLAQIAAAANSHLLVEKSLDPGATHTRVTPLDDAGRETEIARLIGGDLITDATRASARELLAYYG